MNDGHDGFQQVQLLVLQRPTALVMVLVEFNQYVARQVTRTAVPVTAFAPLTITGRLLRMVTDVPVLLQTWTRVQQEHGEVLAEAKPP